MKLETAKEIAKELYDGKITLKELKEGTRDECDYRVISEFFLDMVGKDQRTELHREYKEVMFTDPMHKKPRHIRTWGTKKLDEGIAPIEDHSYIIFVGGENSGKTTFMFDFAIKNALDDALVLFYSLEMTDDQVISRLAREKAGITKSEYRTREIPEDKMFIYNQEYRRISSIDRLLLKGTGDNQQSFDEMLKEIASVNPDICIIDNLGLINEFGKNEIERQMTISKKLIAFTNNTNIPVILVHHLGKKTDKKNDNVRGTQKLLDDPDMVLMAGRKTEETHPDITEEEKKEFFIKVRKDRLFGDTGRTFCVYWEGGKFTDSNYLEF